MGGGGSTLKATPPKINPKLAAAYESIGPDRVADLIFKALDANADGKLSQLELQGYLMSRDAWLKKEDVDPIFAALDVNGDNSLSRDELRNGLASTAGEKPPVLWLMALDPAPAGMGVFKDLVRAGGTVDIPDAAYRAMTLRQLKAVLAHAQKRCVAEGWIGFRFGAGGVMVPQTCPPGCSMSKQKKVKTAPDGLITATVLTTIKDSKGKVTKYEELIKYKDRNDYEAGVAIPRNKTKRYELLTPEGLNLYDMASHVILPITCGLTLPDGKTQPSFVECVADGPQKPHYFVSHFCTFPPP